MFNAVNKVGRLLAYPNNNTTPEYNRKVNLFTVSVVYGAIFTAGFLPMYLYLGFDEAVTIVPLISLGFILSGLLFRITGNLILAGNVFALNCLLGMVGIAVAGNGIFMPTIPYLVSVVVSGFWYANQKWGFIWVGITSATISTIAFLQHFGYLTLTIPYNEELNYIYYGVSAAGLVFYVLIVVYNYEFSRNVAMNQLEHAHNEIRNQHEELQQQTEEIQQQRDTLEMNSRQLEQAYTQITDSVKYAKRIQSAILGDQDQLKGWFKESFLFFQPKDIVSGDFYWMEEVDGKQIIIVADCTGHGVPGAFMTIYGTMVFDEVVSKKGITDPGEILNEANNYLIKELQTKNKISDGMDAAILVVDKKAGKISFAGAKNPLYKIDKNREMVQVKGSKAPVGAIQQKTKIAYDTHTFDYVQGECYYIFTDGYQDQFGGELKRKFMTKVFRQMLHEYSDLPFATQREKLAQRHYDWKGEGKQTDDILVVGISL